jgi:hypothetical protein
MTPSSSQVGDPKGSYCWNTYEIYDYCASTTGGGEKKKKKIVEIRSYNRFMKKTYIKVPEKIPRAF